MFSMILKKHSMNYLYRLVKPNISQYKSIDDLLYDQKQRQIELIQKINQQTLQRNKLFTNQKFISSVININNQDIFKQINQNQVNFTTIFPNSLKNFTLQQNINNGQINQYPFSLQQIQPNLPNFNQIPMHFSYKRGIAVVPQYQFDKKVAYIFNLPTQFNPKDISQKIGLQTIKQIKVQYCRLGLPAYAKVYFNSDQAITNLVLNNKTYIELNNTICYIKTHFDKEKLDTKNRRLAIHNLGDHQSQQKDLILRLSQYGRVLHLDYPTFISRNISLDQLKDHYKLKGKNSGVLLKINIYRKDGSVDQEYYPSIQQIYSKQDSSIANFDAKIRQQRQQQKVIYRNRMRYAHQVDYHQGKQNQISIKNMGYCVVTYSTIQQAQNCYFNQRFTNKITLFDNKKVQQFEIDQSFRKRILRYIDSEYRKTKQNQKLYKNAFQKQNQQHFNQLSLFDKLVFVQQHQDAIKQKLSRYNEEQPEVLLSWFRSRINQIKRDIGNKLGSKSFDQLAQQQLFGRKLQKTDAKKQKLQLDVLPQLTNQMKQILAAERLTKLSSSIMKDKEEYYRKLKARATGKIKASSEVQQIEGGQQVAQGIEQAQADLVDEQHTGKRGFSTIKKRAISFRSRTAFQQANYILRYCQYIRNIINEYLGIFPENKLKPNLDTNGTFLNPQKLKLSDGTQFITEQDIPKFLQCLKNSQKAQQLYTNFWKNYQIFKSKGININQFKYNMKNKQFETLQKYADMGIVKQVYEIDQNQNIQSTLNYLNGTIAGFGQEFKVHQDENGKVIVKVNKIQHIYPLDRMKKITQTKTKYAQQIKGTEYQFQIFNKFKQQMIETGQIPEQIRKQFNIPENKSLDDLFQQLAAQTGIYKKDIQMLMNLQNFTDQQIGQDIALQLELEKARINIQESKASDYGKDPSNIAVRDKQGYFKVSKFRQI